MSSSHFQPICNVQILVGFNVKCWKGCLLVPFCQKTFHQYILNQVFSKTDFQCNLWFVFGDSAPCWSNEKWLFFTVFDNIEWNVMVVWL